MAKKKTKTTKKKLTLIDRLPKNEKERLELMLFFTERAIKGTSDQFLVNQADRIKEKIKNLNK